MRARVLALALAACAGHAAPQGVVVGSSSATAPPDAAAPLPTLACVDGNPRGDWNPYERALVVQASDGSHADTCDDRGNLVSYQCELRNLDCPRGHSHERHMVAPCYEQSGAVTREEIDCDGRCRDGACASRCPAAGDHLTVTSIAGGVVFTSDADPRAIACTLAYDQPGDTFDCAADRKVGDVFTVEGLGLSTTTCTGGTWGAISDRQCTYSDCRYVR